MTDQDRQLISLIAREVLAALASRPPADSASGRGVAPAETPGNTPGNTPAPSSPAPGRADIRPPVGVCTGDYSQFPELAGKLHSSPSPPGRGQGEGYSSDRPNAADVPGAIPHALPAPPNASPLPLTGIVTANQLADAINAAPDHVAILAHDARLTPLANDLLRQAPAQVRRLSSLDSLPNDDYLRPLPWLCWTQGQCPVARDTVANRPNLLHPLAASPEPAALPAVLRDLASALRNRTALGGILFVPSAARAACLANRCPALRAVVATCDQAVEEAVTQIGANILIIEYPHHSRRSMESIIARILRQLPNPPPALERDLADLHRW